MDDSRVVQCPRCGTVIDATPTGGYSRPAGWRAYDPDPTYGLSDDVVPPIMRDLIREFAESRDPDPAEQDGGSSG